MGEAIELTQAVSCFRRELGCFQGPPSRWPIRYTSWLMFEVIWFWTIAEIEAVRLTVSYYQEGAANCGLLKCVDGSQTK